MAEQEDTEETTLDRKLRRAREAYEKQKSAADWGEVAQMIGRAGAQYGAAQAGVPGIEKMRMIPEADYDKQRESALSEYKTDISAAGEISRAEERKAEEARRKKERVEDVDYRERALKSRVGSTREDPQVRRVFAAEMDNIESSEKMATKRKSELEELNKGLDGLAAKASAKKLDPVEERKLSTNPYFNKLRNSINEKLKGEWFISESDRKEAAAAAFAEVQKELEADIQKEDYNLQAASEKRQKLYRGEILPSSTAKQTAGLPGERKVVEQKKPGPSRDPKIEQYAQQNKLDYDKAKKILIGRGYKPADAMAGQSEE